MRLNRSMLSSDGQDLARTNVAQFLRFFYGVFILKFKYLFWQRSCKKTSQGLSINTMHGSVQSHETVPFNVKNKDCVMRQICKMSGKNKQSYLCIYEPTLVFDFLKWSSAIVIVILPMVKDSSIFISNPVGFELLVNAYQSCI